MPCAVAAVLRRLADTQATYHTDGRRTPSIVFVSTPANASLNSWLHTIAIAARHCTILLDTGI